MKSYCGIGSRSTPADILDEMGKFAAAAAPCWILRSGGAEGADSAFEKGATGKGAMEIFLPWKNFSKNASKLYEIHPDAFKLAESVHPAFKYAKRPVKLLIARNMQQILGADLQTPVEFVICWTKDGCESHETYNQKTGGTGSAIALASKAGIPVYNLNNGIRLVAAYQHMLDKRISPLQMRREVDPSLIV